MINTAPSPRPPARSESARKPLLALAAASFGIGTTDTALCHGAFFGLGAVVAAALVVPERKAQAIAMMFAGLTLANVLGVPFGTAIGEAFGWRDTFFIVATIGVLAALALHAWLPRDLPVPPMDLAREARSLGHPQVILAMLISVVSSASLFSVFTCITPILESVTRISPHGVTLMLLLFGIGLTLGNVLGGRLADWKLMPSVIGLLAALVPVLCLFTLTSAAVAPAAGTLLLWGVVSFALIAPLQSRVVDQAAQAPNLASTLNQGAFNFGNATGAWIGGMGLSFGAAYADLPWIGAALAMAALGLALLSWRIERRGQRTSAAMLSISRSF